MMSEYSLIIVSYITAIYFGLIVGNFATTLFYRLPRNINLFGFAGKNSQPPMCSKCYHPLKFYEYLPLISWLTNFGKCRYCKEKIDLTYTLIEVYSALLSCLCYYAFEFYDWYIIFFFFGISSLLASLIFDKFSSISKNLLLFVAVLGMLYQTLVNLSVYEWLFRFAISGCLCIFFYQKATKFRILISHDLLAIIIISSIWCNLYLLIPYLVIVLMNYVIFKKYKIRMSEKFYNYSYFVLFVGVFLNHVI